MNEEKKNDVGPGEGPGIDSSVGMGNAAPASDPVAKEAAPRPLLPTPGRIVAYILDDDTARPAIITSVVTQDWPMTVNLRVFVEPGDGKYRALPNFDSRNGASFVPNVSIGTIPGTWSWPPRY